MAVDRISTAYATHTTHAAPIAASTSATMTTAAAHSCPHTGTSLLVGVDLLVRGEIAAAYAICTTHAAPIAAPISGTMATVAAHSCPYAGASLLVRVEMAAIYVARATYAAPIIAPTSAAIATAAACSTQAEALPERASTTFITLTEMPWVQGIILRPGQVVS